MMPLESPRLGPGMLVEETRGGGCENSNSWLEVGISAVVSAGVESTSWGFEMSCVWMRLVGGSCCKGGRRWGFEGIWLTRLGRVVGGMIWSTTE